MGVQTAAAVVVFAAASLAAGRAELVLPFIAGGVVYSICWIAGGYHLLKNQGKPPKKAEKSLRKYFLLRLPAIFGSLLLVMKIGEPFFWAAVAGIACMFIIMMANAIVYSYQDSRR